MYEGKNVLVTGGAGLVGSNLIERLLPMGGRIRATLRPGGRPPNVKDHRVRYVERDLTQSEHCLDVVEGMDYVFMCAAHIAGAGVITRSPLFNVTSNTLLNVNMLQAAHQAGVKKYLTIGSSTAYPPSEQPLVEERMMDGDPYPAYFNIGWVMRFKEQLARMYSRGGMPVLVLRPTNIYGPYDNYDLESSHVTPALVRKAVEKNDPLEVWGTGEDIRDLVYVDDLVDAALLAMEKQDGYDPINISSGQGHSIKAILRAILDAEGYTPHINYNITKPSTIPVRLLDNTKAHEILGWSPKTPLEEGIAKTVEWYRTEGYKLWR